MNKIKIILNSIKVNNISLFGLLKYLIYVIYVLILELINNIDFIKYKIYENEDNHSYEMTDIYTLNKILKQMKISSNDCILDIGCGKGIAIYIFSKYFKRIYGVELDKEIFKICEKNLYNLDINANIYNINIIDYTISDDVNYIFMFNPFSNKIMEKVVCKIKNDTILIYHNPVCEEILYENNFIKLQEYKDVLGIKICVYKKINR